MLRRLSRRRLLGRSCQVSAPDLRSSSRSRGWYRSWRRLSRPEPRPGGRHGPLFLGVPLRAVCAAASAPWGPGAPLACAPHVRRGRVPLTSVARLFRAFLRAFSVPAFAPPLLLHPIPRFAYPPIILRCAKAFARLVGASLRRLRRGRPCGPRFLGVPLRAVCAAHLRRGAPVPLRLVRCVSGTAGSRSLR